MIFANRPCVARSAEALNYRGDGHGDSLPSNTATVLAQPTDLTATAVSGSEIDLSWTSDSSVGVNILRWQGAAGSPDEATVIPVSAADDAAAHGVDLSKTRFPTRARVSPNSPISLSILRLRPTRISRPLPRVRRPRAQWWKRR